MVLEFQFGFKQYIEKDLKNKIFVEVPVKEEQKKYVINIIVNNKYENIDVVKQFISVG